MAREMTLSKKERREIGAEEREKLKKKLDSIPEGKRMVFADEYLDILEDLIFDYYDVKLINHPFVKEGYKDKKVEIKYIALEGKYLRKLDLSKVSFKNLVWGGSEDLKKMLVNCEYDLVDVAVNLSGTNANIDFSESAFSKYLTLPLYIFNCNFNGLDLSENTLRNFLIHTCDFEGTRIKLVFPEKTTEKAEIYSSNMNGLTTFKDWPEIGFGWFDYIFKDENSSFIGTGLKFNFLIKDSELKKFFSRSIKLRYEEGTTKRIGVENIMDNFSDLTVRKYYKEIYDSYSRTINSIISIVNMMYQGKLSGCYFNGKRILSTEEKQALKTNLQQRHKLVRGRKRERYPSAISRATIE